MVDLAALYAKFQKSYDKVGENKCFEEFVVNICDRIFQAEFHKVWKSFEMK